MPQAIDELRERWGSMEAALKQLEIGVHFTNNAGLIKPIGIYTPTEDDYSAISYLFAEWDFAYVMNETSEAE